MILAGYIFSAINYLFYCVGRFTKKKPAILMFSLVALCMAGISNYCFGSLTGSLALFVQIPIVILSYINEKKPLQNWLRCCIYEVAFLLITLILIFTFQGITSILIYIATNLSIYSYWWMDEQGMRIAGIFIGIAFFVYCMSIENYLGFLELCVIFANLVSYAIYKNRIKQINLSKL